MQISSYLFQSPYSQAVQIGRPDPAMLQEQQKETQRTQEESQQAVAGMSSNAFGSRSTSAETTSGALAANQVAQQTAQSFQVASRSSAVQAYVQNSLGN